MQSNIKNASWSLTSWQKTYKYWHLQQRPIWNITATALTKITKASSIEVLVCDDVCCAILASSSNLTTHFITCNSNTTSHLQITGNTADTRNRILTEPDYLPGSVEHAVHKMSTADHSWRRRHPRCAIWFSQLQWLDPGTTLVLISRKP